MYLEPFTREQLIEILSSAASQHESIYNEIKLVASSDVTHRKIFVRGLSWETNTSDLVAVFNKFGSIEEAAVIMDKGTGKSKGYGFVTFTDMEGAQQALLQPSKTIKDRATICNLASARQQGPVAGGINSPSVSLNHGSPRFGSMGSNSNPAMDNGDPGTVDDRRLFVRGLSWETSNETLHKAFSAHGAIEDAIVATDRSTRKSKGFGFVTFVHQNSTKRALQQPNKMIDGRNTQCNLACEGKNQQQQSFHPNSGGAPPPHRNQFNGGRPPQQFPRPNSSFQARPPFLNSYNSGGNFPHPPINGGGNMPPPQQPPQYGGRGPLPPSTYPPYGQYPPPTQPRY